MKLLQIYTLNNNDNMNHQLMLISDYHTKLSNYQLKLIRKCQFTKLKITGVVDPTPTPHPNWKLQLKEFRGKWGSFLNTRGIPEVLEIA